LTSKPQKTIISEDWQWSNYSSLLVYLKDHTVYIANTQFVRWPYSRIRRTPEGFTFTHVFYVRPWCDLSITLSFLTINRTRIGVTIYTSQKAVECVFIFKKMRKKTYQWKKCVSRSNTIQNYCAGTRDNLPSHACNQDLAYLFRKSSQRYSKNGLHSHK
jgi:hypothetical protein